MDFDPETSDADFLVEFFPASELVPFDQYFDFADALRRTLDRPVDLVESGAIENPYLRAAIVRFNSCRLLPNGSHSTSSTEAVSNSEDVRYIDTIVAHAQKNAQRSKIFANSLRALIDMKRR